MRMTKKYKEELIKLAEELKQMIDDKNYTVTDTEIISAANYLVGYILSLEDSYLSEKRDKEHGAMGRFGG
jgi:hypothetical protein